MKRMLVFDILLWFVAFGWKLARTTPERVASRASP